MRQIQQTPDLSNIAKQDLLRAITKRKDDEDGWFGDMMPFSDGLCRRNMGLINGTSLSPDNALCNSGKNQSPVNIDPAKTFNAQSVRGKPWGIKFNYGLLIADSIKNTGNLVQVEARGGNIQVDGIEFELKHLDFHIPSENTLAGQHFPLEIQFFHESKNKEQATVSMMIVPGRQSRLLSKLLPELPEVGQENRLSANTIRSIEMEKKIGSYYRYNGSLTKPPCTEGVRWFVMKQNQTMSKEQYQQLKAAISVDNNRPVQALNARMIVE
ncbi:Carbonic anhydrase [Nymphon striatum]|nr:Carbonic anhydrase [Nymphon striatum]